MEQTQKLNELIAVLTQQEDQLVLDSFTHDDAIAIGERVLAAGRSAELPIAIDVSAFGQTLFHAGLPGSGPDNDEWIRRKRNVVHRFQKSSYRVGRELARDGLGIDERSYVDPMDFSPHGGCFPVRLSPGGGVIGTITVSGLTQDEDHRLVVNTLAELLGRTIPDLPR